MNKHLKDDFLQGSQSPGYLGRACQQSLDEHRGSELEVPGKLEAQQEAKVDENCGRWVRGWTEASQGGAT